MKKLIFVLAIMLAGCATEPVQEPTPFGVKEVIQPPMGCVALRKIDTKADC